MKSGLGKIGKRLSGRYMKLERLAQQKGLGLYRIWGGYELVRIGGGVKIELQYLDEVEEHLKGLRDE
jgi:hypothetical protein